MSERRPAQPIELPTPGRKPGEGEKPIPNVYPVIDSDLARDNVEKNMTAADKEDLPDLPVGPPKYI